MKYLIGNWKANKNLNESLSWVGEFAKLVNGPDKTVKKNLDGGKLKIIVCPPSPFIVPMKEKAGNLKNIEIGSQDLSRIEKGTYTGEVSAMSLQGVVKYSILGHSERRQHFVETVKDINAKLELGEKYGIDGIYCFSEPGTVFPGTVKFVAYEPVTAISTGDGRGSSESVENVLKVKSTLKIASGVKFIYGGSVNETNVGSYTGNKAIDGVLVGGASLDPQRFFKLALNI